MKPDELAIEVGRVYAKAERDIISRIANRLKADKSLSITQWERKKLNELRILRSGIEKQIVAKLDNYVDKDMIKVIQSIYDEGSNEAIKELTKYNITDITKEFGRIDERAIETYVKSLNNKMKSTHLRIVRKADDVYRQAVSNGVNQVLTGTGTRVEGSQQVLNEFANRGVTGFVDNAGRSWNLQTYAEMATRTTSIQARTEARLNRFTQNNEDLVIITAHAESCPICDPWEGQVLSITGQTEGYPTIDDAISDGLWHPNCGHGTGLYIPGVTEPLEPVTGDEAYEERQQQRYNERKIRQWKRREVAAMTDKDLKKSQAKIREWQERQREFIEKTDRKRKYIREQIHVAH